jgi:5'-nucleotidase
MRMRILISNDDGYLAPGIIALYQALKTMAQVEVIAPEHNNSAKSNALTLNAPIYIRHAENGFKYVTGTPADCVHIALTGYLNYKPDLIVSGINNGANMGDDTIYSGTVGAAMEAYLMGIPAIAFSQVERGWTYIDDAAEKAKQLVTILMQDSKINDAPWLVNVNIPNRPLSQMGEAKLTRLGRRHPAQSYITQESPRGETMYWIGSAGAAKDEAHDTDFHATSQGHVSLTPLQVDLTDHDALPFWRDSEAAWNKLA